MEHIKVERVFPADKKRVLLISPYRKASYLETCKGHLEELASLRSIFFIIARG